MFESFLTRHSLKPEMPEDESAEYPGLTEAGAELARKRARQEILELVEKSERGTVVFIGGASNLPRTKSTAEIYGDELKEINPEDALVVTRQEIAKIYKEEKSYKGTLEKIAESIKQNENKKIIIVFPMFLKGLSPKDEGHEFFAYYNQLLEKHGGDESAAIKDWLETNGKVDGKQAGPVPQELARNIESELERLKTFAQKHFDGRPLITGLVGHSWLLDAFLYEKIGEKALEKGMINETELAKIKVGPDKTEIEYRGETFALPAEEG